MRQVPGSALSPEITYPDRLFARFLCHSRQIALNSATTVSFHVLFITRSIIRCYILRDTDSIVK